MNKIKIVVAIATIYTGFSGMSYAADASTTVKEPLSQATTSVGKNLTRDPDSKGLNNANSRLQTNEERLDTKQTTITEKSLNKTKHTAKKEHTDHTDKHADISKIKATKAERADKAQRIDKASRPEKAERPEKVERPERVGPGH